MFKKYRTAYRLYVVLVAGLFTIAAETAPAQGVCVTSANADCDEITRSVEINSGVPDLRFTDTSSLPGGNDWRIDINFGDTPYWAVEDEETGNLVFRLDGGVPENSIRVASGGDIGLGTATPGADIHVVRQDVPTLRLQSTRAFFAHTWDISGGGAFSIDEVTNGTNPFRIESGAPSNSLQIASNGDVGLGTSTPAFPLHIVRAAGTSIGDNVGFRLENSSAGSSWVFTGVEGNTDHFIINKLGSGMQEVRLNEGGDMMIPGTLTTGGPVCGGGCDELFSPAGEVESIEDHAAAMWENTHLSAVGPTEPGQPMNLSVKVGGLINELEKAHIYIERLHERLKEKDNRIRELEDRNTEVVRRLSRLEALLGVVPASD